MNEYIVSSDGLRPVDELMHYAKGSTKANAKYISRKKVNGKWVYTYNKPGTVRSGGTPSGWDVNTDQAYANAQDTHEYAKMYPVARQHAQSRAESEKRMQSSAQRNVQNSLSYKIRAKTAYYKNKGSQFIKKFTTKNRYTKVQSHTTAQFGTTVATFDNTNYLDKKTGKFVNLGKNFIKYYGL